MNLIAAAMVFALLSAAVGAQGPASLPKVTPRSILVAIEKKGAEAVLKELYEGWANAENDHFLQVLSHIERGQRPWLLVAQKLRAVSDAGASSMLDEVITPAMLRNPNDVLVFFGSDERNDGFAFCQSLTSLEPKEGVLPYLRRVERALVALQNPTLPWRRTLCLKQVRAEIVRSLSVK